MPLMYSALHTSTRAREQGSTVTAIDLTVSYYSISLSLVVLLVLMIVIRLAVHVRNVQKATGASDGSGVHTAAATVVSMLIESYALYAITLLLYIVSWADNSWVAALFNGACAVIQVRVCLCLSRCATGIAV